MTLEELITALDAADPTLVLPHGFTNPHSYRGYYEDLAFEPATDVPVADMLADARSALGTTYTGWKGGDYTMRGFTDCWLAEQGCLGETLGALLLSLMLAAGIRDAARTAAARPHACGSCDGIDPASCLTNPDRAARQTTGQAGTETAPWIADGRHGPTPEEAAAGFRAFAAPFKRPAPAVGQPAEAQAAAMVCANCGTSVQWIYCPTGGWWAHNTHPSDGHDAYPKPATAVTVEDER